MPNDPDVFRLKRNLSLVRLIGIFDIVAALPRLYRDTAGRTLTRHQTEANVAIATTLANAAPTSVSQYRPGITMTRSLVTALQRHVHTRTHGAC